MATCPDCGASSRTDPTFEVTRVLVAKPFGTFSVAGAQTKTVASERMKLSHLSCGWSVLGRLEGSDFVADAAPASEESL